MDEMGAGTRLNLTHIVRPARDNEAAGDAGTPGLLMLHGRGADEEDLMGLEQALDPRLTIVSARAPYRLGPGFAWYGMAQVGSPDMSTMLTSVDELHTFIQEMVKAYKIDPERLYLLGFSQGAIMSAAMALTIPERIGAVVMHSGYVPTNPELNPRPEMLKGKPFFVAHGMYDEVIPVSFGRKSEQYLASQGARLTYREYPIGHGISEESLYDLSEWLTAVIDET